MAVVTPEGGHAVPPLFQTRQVHANPARHVATPVASGLYMKHPESIATINTERKGRGVVARRHIGKGETILKFFGDVVPCKKMKNPEEFGDVHK